ncbi:MAG: SBBP repeat-containing protein [Planctomycetales bacterium]|nr:SBBP repeat-containing protein [bacterium]UNM09899.1 MAG: SBBP repeat-containing protein [Planctomycetales bacterium]
MTGMKWFVDFRTLFSVLCSLASIAGMLLCLSCSTGSELRDQHPDPASIQAPEFAGLPSPLLLDDAATKVSSGTNNRLGSQYLLKDAMAMDSGGTLHLIAGTGEYSWAIYQYDFPAICRATGCSYVLSGEPDAGAQVFLAIADYSTGRWRFAAPGSDSMELSEPYGTFSSPAGKAHLAVVAWNGSATVSQMRLEDYPVPLLDGWLHSFDSSVGSPATDQPIMFMQDSAGRLMSIGRSNVSQPQAEFYDLLLRYDQSGNLLDAKEIRLDDETLTSPVVDRPYMALAANGDIYVTASIRDELSQGDKGDIAVIKLTSNLEIIWATRLTGPEQEMPNGIAVDGSGNVLVIGNSAWAGVAPKPDVTQFSYILKLSTDGNLLWNKLVEPTFRDERPLQILCDPDDDSVHLKGEVGITDGLFLAKLDSAGAAQYAKYWSNDSTSSTGVMSLESDGKLLLCMLETTPGSGLGTPEDRGAVLCRIATDGTVSAATQFHASLPEFLYGMARIENDGEGGLRLFGNVQQGFTIYNTIFRFAASDLAYQGNLQLSSAFGFVMAAPDGGYFFTGGIYPSSRCSDLVPRYGSFGLSSSDGSGLITLSDTAVVFSELGDYVSSSEDRLVIVDSPGTADVDNFDNSATAIVRYNPVQ